MESPAAVRTPLFVHDCEVEFGQLAVPFAWVGFPHSFLKDLIDVMMSAEWQDGIGLQSAHQVDWLNQFLLML